MPRTISIKDNKIVLAITENGFKHEVRVSQRKINNISEFFANTFNDNYDLVKITKLEL
jgi:hypothetical protein